jgi:hypothetical protein
MDLEIEKMIRIIIVVAVLVIVVISIAMLWQKYLKPYLEDLGKPETAGIKAGFMLLLLIPKNRIKRYLISNWINKR